MGAEIEFIFLGVCVAGAIVAVVALTLAVLVLLAPRRKT